MVSCVLSVLVLQRSAILQQVSIQCFQFCQCSCPVVDIRITACPLNTIFTRTAFHLDSTLMFFFLCPARYVYVCQHHQTLGLLLNVPVKFSSFHCFLKSLDICFNCRAAPAPGDVMVPLC